MSENVQDTQVHACDVCGELAVGVPDTEGMSWCAEHTPGGVVADPEVAEEETPEEAAPEAEDETPDAAAEETPVVDEATSETAVVEDPEAEDETPAVTEDETPVVAEEEAAPKPRKRKRGLFLPKE